MREHGIWVGGNALHIIEEDCEKKRLLITILYFILYANVALLITILCRYVAIGKNTVRRFPIHSKH